MVIWHILCFTDYHIHISVLSRYYWAEAVRAEQQLGNNSISSAIFSESNSNSQYCFSSTWNNSGISRRHLPSIFLTKNVILWTIDLCTRPRFGIFFNLYAPVMRDSGAYGFFFSVRLSYVNLSHNVWTLTLVITFEL